LVLVATAVLSILLGWATVATVGPTASLVAGELVAMAVLGSFTVLVWRQPRGWATWLFIASHVLVVPTYLMRATLVSYASGVFSFATAVLLFALVLQMRGDPAPAIA
jgi:hypothetical protein